MLKYRLMFLSMSMIDAGIPRSHAMYISGHKTDSIFRRYDIMSDDWLTAASVKCRAYSMKHWGRKRHVKTKQLQSQMLSRDLSALVTNCIYLKIRVSLKLGVSRQTVLQRGKAGELEAVLVRQGRRKGLRIRVVDQQPQLFEVFS